MAKLPKDCYELYDSLIKKFDENAISFEEMMASLTKTGYFVQLDWKKLKAKEKKEMYCPLFFIHPINKAVAKAPTQDIVKKIGEMVADGYNIYISETLVERWEYPTV